MSPTSLPITFNDVLAARDRIAPHLRRTPLRAYPELDRAIGHDIRVLIKHENHHPTNSFKVRNGVSAVTALSAEQRSRGVVCGTRGNHGLGVAFAASALGIGVTVVVPRNNNPEKNAAIRGYGARLIEFGAHYDEAAAESERIAAEEGVTLLHSTNNRDVIAGAATLTLEILEEAPVLDAMVIAVGGGSQAVGALTVLASQRPEVKVYGVQAAGAPAVYESWKAGRPVPPITPQTIADGIATAGSFALTLSALIDGLAGFVTVSEGEIVEATRLMIRTTHNLAEPSGAVGLAGLSNLAAKLAGRTICVILSGSNAEAVSLRRILAYEN